MTELAPRRLFQTCTWVICSTNSGSVTYSATALNSKLLKKKNLENIEDQVAIVLSTR